MKSMVMGVVLALVLGGCATTSEQTAERFRLAEVALENANLIANNLHDKGQISETDWPQVRAGLDAASADVAKAKAANEANPDLNVVWEVLNELNQRLMPNAHPMPDALIRMPRNSPPR